MPTDMPTALPTIAPHAADTHDTAPDPLSQECGDVACTVPAGKRQTLAELRRRVGVIENRSAAPRAPRDRPGTTPAWDFGDPNIDASMPSGGLPRHGLQEIAVTNPRDHAAATGFCLALLARLHQSDASSAAILWCQNTEAMREHGRPYGHGLRALGLDPDRIVLAAARRDAEVLWTMEEGLRTPGLSAVVGEVSGLDFTAGKRLSLAAREGGVAGLAVRRVDGLPSAARMCWRIAPLPAAPHPWNPRAAAAPRWQVELVRARAEGSGTSKPGAWTMEWNSETRRFHLVAAMADRSLEPRAGAPQAPLPAPAPARASHGASHGAGEREHQAGWRPTGWRQAG